MPTLTVNIAAMGTILNTGKPSISGHMWYVVTDDSGVQHQYGFAPISEFSSNGPGKVYSDDNSTYGTPAFTRSVTISDSQAQALEDFGANTPGFSSNYNVLTNNCVTFTWAALATIGISNPLVIDPTGAATLPIFDQDDVRIALSAFEFANGQSAGNPQSEVDEGSWNGGWTVGMGDPFRSEVYHSAQLSTSERITVNDDGSYDLSELDPVSNAIVVTAHVSPNGNYKVTIDCGKLVNASAQFNLPEWATVGVDLYTSADRGVFDDGTPDPGSPAGITTDIRGSLEPYQGAIIVIQKTGNLITVTETFPGLRRIIENFTADGQPIDARSFDQNGREIFYLKAGSGVDTTRYITDDPQADVGVSPYGSRQVYGDYRWFFSSSPDNPPEFSLPVPTLPIAQNDNSSGLIASGHVYEQGQVYQEGDGTLDVPTGGGGAGTPLQLGGSFTPSGMQLRVAAANAAIVVTDGRPGDAITIELGSGDIAGISGVRFADGTIWSIADMLQAIATQNQDVTQLVGTSGSDTLTATAGQTYMFGGGGNDIFNVVAGNGKVEIDEQDSAQNRSNNLQVTGVILAALSVTASLDGQSLVVKDGVAGDEIVLDRMLIDPTSGVQSLTLSDGTSLSSAQLLQMEMTGTAGDDFLVGNSGANVLDGHGGNDLVLGGGGNDTFVFQAGYGHLEIRETDPNASADNVLEMGAGISQSSLTVSATANGTGLVILDGTSGDSVVLDGALTNASNGVQQVRFSDGSSLTAAQLIGMETTGTSGADTLYGSDRADLFDGKGGNDLEIGNGGNDTFSYQAGYGKLEISEFDWNDSANNVLQLGPGISEASLVVGRTADGTGLVLTDSVAGDEITIDNMLTSSFNGVQSVRFSDGSVISRADLLQMEQTGTTGSDTLVGTSGADLLDGKGGNDIAIGRGGDDTFVFAAGYGQLEVEENSSSPTDLSTLKLSGINEASIHISATPDGTGLVVSDGVDGDQITLDDMLAGSDQGVGQFEFDDGTVWSRSQIIQLGTTGTSGDDTLYGSPGAELLDGQGGNDVEVGNGGGDTFIFNQGYGQLEVNEVDDSNSPNNVLQLGAGINLASLIVTSDGVNIFLADGVDGDQITLDDMLAGASYGVQKVQFADGTTLSRSQLVQMAATGTTGYDSLYGTDGAELFDGKGSSDYEHGGGGEDTFVFNQGYGQLEIDETDYSATPENVLQLGSGISASSVTVTSFDGVNLVLTDGVAGDKITLDNMLYSNGYGVQQVQFADGTTWSRSQLVQMETTGTTGDDTLYGSYGPDLIDGRGGNDYEQGNGGGDTFIFNQGYGQLDIAESDAAPNPANVLVFGPGISASATTVSATSDGTGIVLTDGTAGDQVTLNQMLAGGSGSGVQQVQFSDGTTWSRGQLIQVELAGATTGSDTLAGSTGADLFDGKGGDDLEIGIGGGDTFIFNQGYGQLEINEDDQGANPDNVLQLGSGINESDLTVSAGDYGTNLVLKDGTSGDQITLDRMLLGSEYGVQVVQFADGATLSAAQLLQLEMTGTSGNDSLYGTRGPDLLDGKGGNDLEEGNGGNDTFIFNQGYGQLDIAEQDFGPNPQNVLKLGAGITESSITVSESSPVNIQISDGTPGDQITLEYMIEDGSHGVQSIEFADGTIWSRDQILQMATTGTTGNDSLYGSMGADVLDGKGGNDYEEGDGGGDTFIFNPGYGSLEIDEADYSAHPANVLKLGSGITTSAVIVSATANGQGLVLHDGTAGDQITIDSMLSDAASGIQSVQFADGTTWSRQELIQMETTGTAGNDTLYGSTGDDTFDGQGGTDLEIGRGGNDTYVLKPGYGALSIENGNSAHWWSSGSGELAIQEAVPQDLWLQRVGNALQVDLMGSSTSATIADWYGDNYSQLAAIDVSDGTPGGSYALDSQVSQLVQAMATFSANNPGFDPTSSANPVITDPTVLAAVNTAWHQ
ncbi:beta strand repeat-containing protein [Paraburkholderia sediminicola]|uniref:beta strand repeat-containing protein n=1 Tax=Paraburkholderia sediminicola TaxID=458836 RepID=UPI0038B78C12